MYHLSGIKTPNIGNAYIYNSHRNQNDAVVLADT